MLPTLLGAAVCMRKSCSEVNRGGSQADSHVIKAKWNIRRRGRDQNTTRKGSSKSYREAPHNKESRQKDDSKLDVLSLLRRPGVCVCVLLLLLLHQQQHFKQHSSSSLSAGRRRAISLTEVYILLSTLTIDSLKLHSYCIQDKSLKG